MSWEEKEEGKYDQNISYEKNFKNASVLNICKLFIQFSVLITDSGTKSFKI